MSNFHASQYLGSYHEQSNSSYHPTYPNQYIQTDKGHTGQGQPNEVSNYDAYGYNMAMPAFNPVAVPPVAPVPIFQGWNQDSIPLPPYTAPPNPTPYPGYSSTSQHNPSYFPSGNQASYHQPLATAPASYAQRELSEGEFDERVSAANTPPVRYGAPQYRGNEAVGYVEDAQNAKGSVAQNYNSHQVPYGVNKHNSPPEQPSRQRSDSYSPHFSPREENNAQPGVNNYSERNVQDSTSGGLSGTSRQENGQPPKISGSNSLNNNVTNSRSTPQAVQDSTRIAAFKSPLKEIRNASNIRSEPEARKNAQGAILSLLPYDIRYQTYIDEGFREETVARLFDELKLPRAPGNVTNGLQREESQNKRRRPSRNSESIQNGHLNSSSTIPVQLAGLEGGSGNTKQVSSLPPTAVIPPPHNSGTTAPPNPEASAALNDKERKIQAKMDALRKSREERAQKVAANKGIKVAPTATPAVVPLPDKPKSLDPSQDLAAVSKSAISTIQLRSADADAVAQLNTVAEPRHPTSQSIQPHLTSNTPNIPNIPGLFLASSTSSTSSPAPLANIQSTMFASANSNSRKRPVAADFDNSRATPAKRPFGHSSVHEALVIDVSEDEESDDEDVAMDLDSEANQDSPVQPAATLSDLYSSAAPNAPYLANLPKRRKDSPNSSATNTPPILAAAFRPPSTRPADLQRKESEIEELKRRIAQAEARNKARQTPSGTRTPIPNHPNIVESVNNGSSNLALARNAEVSTIHDSVSTAAKVQINTGDQMETSDRSTTFEKAVDMNINEDDGELLRLEEMAKEEVSIRTSEVAQQQKKVEEARLELARTEAAVQEATEKLEQAKERGMRFQQEKELRLQRHNQASQEIAKATTPLPLASTDAGEQDDMTAQIPNTGHSSLPMRPVSANGDRADEVFHNGQILNASQSPVPANATVEEASESLNNGTSDVTVSNESKQTEPVAVTDPMEEDISHHFTPEVALQEPSLSEDASHSPHEGNMDVDMASAPDPSEIASGLHEVEDKSPLSYSPLEDDDYDPIEDRDDYEPPEATPLADSPPFSPAPPNEDGGLLQFDDLMEDRAMSVSSNISRESVEEESDHGVLQVQSGIAPLSEAPKEVPSIQFFTPYESPLRRFRAYRFHPNFATDVPGGLRSLTYSHRIDPKMELCRYELAGGICNDTTCDALHFKDMGLKDDAILTSLGSPEEFKDTRHVEFCNGLKEVLLGLRKRKIRDFHLIASEILAYRARFLGDASKILPLEGVSI